MVMFVFIQLGHVVHCMQLRVYCITRIFRVEEIFAIFANFDFPRNFPPAKWISTAHGISRNFLPTNFSSTRKLNTNKPPNMKTISTVSILCLSMTGPWQLRLQWVIEQLLGPTVAQSLIRKEHLGQRRATFSERGPDETSGAARGPEWQTKTPKWGCNPMYILQYFYYKAGRSVRRLVLLAMEKYFNVRLDGWARQQKNVIEMGVREQGAKARLFVLHFGEDLFATVGAAKHGHGALNMRNVFRKIRGKIFSREEIFARKYLKFTFRENFLPRK